MDAILGRTHFLIDLAATLINARASSAIGSPGQRGALSLFPYRGLPSHQPCVRGSKGPYYHQEATEILPASYHV